MPNIKKMVEGGSVIYENTIELGNLGVKPIPIPALGWGMTELAPAGIIAEVDGAIPGSCGKVCINSEAKVVDVNTGKLLGPNERGELAIRGPQVCYVER